MSNTVLDTQIAEKLDVIRPKSFGHKVVFVDGFPGCGKTMLSPIVSALERVELLTYPFEIEYLATVYSLKKMDRSAVTALIRMYTDMRIYEILQGRVNFRPTDISSVLNDARPWRYIQRMFKKGDEVIPERIARERPILHLCTHRLLRNSEPIFEALGQRVVFLEVVRHPLYMIKQIYLNLERLLDNARDFDLYIEKNGKQLPYWAYGWEDLYLKSNNMERSIYNLQDLTATTEKAKQNVLAKNKAAIITIPFECFVINPWDYMEKITRALETKMVPLTYRMMKKQRVPRKMYADGVALKIYKRCGWKPPQEGSDENKEFESRWQEVSQKASQEAMKVLERLCVDYEEQYLGGAKNYKKI